jgi:SAM-dependent methyltransferase
MNSLLRSFCIAALLLMSVAAAAQASAPARTPDVIFVPTPYPVVEEMLRMGDVSSKDIVYDLGCGDGRTVIMAAKKYGARGVGIDIDPQRIQESIANAKKEGVSDKVKFLQQDLFESDFHEATAVMLYLLSSLNLRLRPILLRQLAPGTPIVSHDFDMGDWKPEQQTQLMVVGVTHRIYRWTVPAKVAGVWQLKAGPKDGTYSSLELEQNIDTVSGNLRANGREYEVSSGSVRGKNLTLEFYGDGGRFDGVIEGATIRGKFSRAGSTLSVTGRRVGSSTVASTQH